MLSSTMLFLCSAGRTWFVHKKVSLIGDGLHGNCLGKNSAYSCSYPCAILSYLPKVHIRYSISCPQGLYSKIKVIYGEIYLTSSRSSSCSHGVGYSDPYLDWQTHCLTGRLSARILHPVFFWSINRTAGGLKRFFEAVDLLRLHLS